MPVHRTYRIDIKKDPGQPIQTPSNGGLVLADAARIQFISFYTLGYFLVLITQLSKILSNQAKTSLLIASQSFATVIGLKAHIPAAQVLACSITSLKD